MRPSTGATRSPSSSGRLRRGAYVQVPFTQRGGGRGAGDPGFAAPLWTAASGCPGPPSSWLCVTGVHGEAGFVRRPRAAFRNRMFFTVRDVGGAPWGETPRVADSSALGNPRELAQ